MKRFNFLNFILASLFLTAAFLGVRAQNPTQTPNQADAQTEDTARPNLTRELNLTPAQIEQIRRIQENNQGLRESRQRLRRARQALDRATYADVPNEAEIQNHLREVQEANAEFIRNRSEVNASIRKVLNPQQLAHFRQLQQQYNQQRLNRQQRRESRMENQETPAQNRPNLNRRNNFPNRRPRRRQQ